MHKPFFVAELIQDTCVQDYSVALTTIIINVSGRERGTSKQHLCKILLSILHGKLKTSNKLPRVQHYLEKPESMKSR